MAISKNAVAGGVAALGGTGAAATGVILANKGGQETIGDRFGSFKITDDEDYGKALTNKGSEDWDKIKTKEELKGWCKKQYSKTITEEIEKDSALFEKIRKRCTLKIKQKLEGKVLSIVDGTGTENPNKEDWKIKIQNFKDYQEPEANDSFDLSKLGDEKTKISSATGDDAWKKLRDWCKATYEKNLIKETTNDFEIAKKFCTKATIKDALHGAVLPETDAEWTTKSTKASSTNTNDQTKDSDLLTNLNKSGANKNQELKNWCLKKYLENHDSKVKENAGDKLLDEVKKWCVLTIKEKLGTGKTFEGTEAISTTDADLKAKMESLSESDQEKDTQLKEKISEWKTGASQTDKQKAFRTWCQGLYAKHYKGTNDNAWFLADKYCKKS